MGNLIIAHGDFDIDARRHRFTEHLAHTPGRLGVACGWLDNLCHHDLSRSRTHFITASYENLLTDATILRYNHAEAILRVVAADDALTVVL